MIVEDHILRVRRRQSGDYCSRDDGEEGYASAAHVRMVARLKALATRCTVLVTRRRYRQLF